jgi:hypothetical protein
MPTSLQSGSATIYQFPARGRFAVGAQSDQTGTATNVMSMSPHAKIVFGSGWYHDEAIQDADRGRKN